MVVFSNLRMSSPGAIRTRFCAKTLDADTKSTMKGRIYRVFKAGVWYSIVRNSQFEVKNQYYEKLSVDCGNDRYSVDVPFLRRKIRASDVIIKTKMV